MMYSGQLPWQGVGKRLNGPVTAREAIKEGPRNTSRATIYEFTRPTLKYINIDGEAVRIEIPVQARISAELQSVK